MAYLQHAPPTRRRAFVLREMLCSCCLSQAVHKFLFFVSILLLMVTCFLSRRRLHQRSYVSQAACLTSTAVTRRGDDFFSPGVCDNNATLPSVCTRFFELHQEVVLIMLSLCQNRRTQTKKKVGNCLATLNKPCAVNQCWKLQVKPSDMHVSIIMNNRFATEMLQPRPLLIKGGILKQPRPTLDRLIETTAGYRRP